MNWRKAKKLSRKADENVGFIRRIRAGESIEAVNVEAFIEFVRLCESANGAA